jgi:electron transport complex protein RnfE
VSTEAIPAPAAVKEKPRLAHELTKGIIIENPILIIMLGLCATLACSTSATDALGMGAAFTFVMICSNVVVALVAKITPHQIRIPVFITVISTFVTIIDYAMKAYTPLLSRSLGVFVPLIVVNCIVMGRAEAYASHNDVASSLMDGIGMSIGFTFIITLIGTIRELIGNGSVFGFRVLPAGYQPFLIFILPPGAFLVIGFLMALHQKLFHKGDAR